MPLVQMKIAGTLSREQKQQIVAEFTATLERVAGKPREYVIVHIEETPEENWGWGGAMLDQIE